MPELRKGKYRHYKGRLYEVIDVARHSETLEEMVVYRTLYTNENGEQTLWVRPLRMFTEDVVVDGKPMPRFESVD
jgi:cyclomaltodextrinase / maltogenic alpha-amylase / neopullulanase